MKERLHSLSVLEPYRETNLALRKLLTAEDEGLRNLWQDKGFLFAFPKMAIFLISNKGLMDFPEDKRTQIFSGSLPIFLSNNTKKLSGYMFTKNGEIVTKNPRGLHRIGSINESEPISNNSSNTITLETGEKTDTFVRTVTASILIIGMSFLDKGRLISLMSESYQKLSSAKKTYLMDNLGRLLETDCPTRAYIKDRKLDISNGFDWDEELAYILFFGIYKCLQQSPGQRLPQEMKDTVLKHYSLEALSVMLDYALDQAEHLQRLRNSSELAGFIRHIETRLTNAQADSCQKMIKDMQEKLNSFKEAVSYKQSKSPNSPDLSLSREIVYLQKGSKNRH